MARAEQAMSARPPKSAVSRVAQEGISAARPPDAGEGSMQAALVHHDAKANSLLDAEADPSTEGACERRPSHAEPAASGMVQRPASPRQLSEQSSLDRSPEMSSSHERHLGWASDRSKRLIKDLPRRFKAVNIADDASSADGHDVCVTRDSLLLASNKLAAAAPATSKNDHSLEGSLNSSARGSMTSSASFDGRSSGSINRSGSSHRDSDQESTSQPPSEVEGDSGIAFQVGAALAHKAELDERGRPESSKQSASNHANASSPPIFRFDIPEAMRTNPMTDPLFHARMITRTSAPTFSAITELQEAVERTHAGMVRLDQKQREYLAQAEGHAAPSEAEHSSSLPHQMSRASSRAAHEECEHGFDPSTGCTCEEDGCECRDDGAYSTGSNNKKRKSGRHGVEAEQSTHKDSYPHSHRSCGNDNDHAHKHESSDATITQPRRGSRDEDEELEPRIIWPALRTPHCALRRRNQRRLVKIKYRALRGERARIRAGRQAEEEASRLKREKEEAAAAAAAAEAAAAAARKKRSSKAEKKAQAMRKAGPGKKLTLAEIKARMQQQDSSRQETSAPAPQAAVAEKIKEPPPFASEEQAPKPKEREAAHSTAAVPSLAVFEYHCPSESADRLVLMRKEIDNMQTTLTESLRPIDDAVVAATEALARIDTGDPNAAASAAAALAAARAALPEQYMRSLTGLQAEWNRSFVNPATETVTTNLAKTIAATETKLAPLLEKSKAPEWVIPAPTPAPQTALPPLPPASEQLSVTSEAVPVPESPPRKSLVSHGSELRAGTTSETKQETKGVPSAPSPQPDVSSLPLHKTSPPPPPSSLVDPLDSSTSPPPPRQKLSRRKKANMNNVHHKSNYVPSRTPSEPPRHARPSDDVAASSGIPPGCLDHPTTSNALFPDEWVCLFCDYELLYGEPPLMLRAIRNRKKIERTRKRAQARAHRAAMGKPDPPRMHDHHHHHHDGDTGSEGGSTVARCECGNPLCYEDD